MDRLIWFFCCSNMTGKRKTANKTKHFYSFAWRWESDVHRNICLGREQMLLDDKSGLPGWCLSSVAWIFDHRKPSVGEKTPPSDLVLGTPPYSEVAFIMSFIYFFIGNSKKWNENKDRLWWIWRSIARTLLAYRCFLFCSFFLSFFFYCIVLSDQLVTFLHSIFFCRCIANFMSFIRHYLPTICRVFLF